MDEKRAALADGALHRGAAAVDWTMCLTIARPRPVPPSLRLRAGPPVEPLEDPRQVLAADAATVVLDADHHLAPLAGASMTDRPARRGCT